MICSIGICITKRRSASNTYSSAAGGSALGGVVGSGGEKMDLLKIVYFYYPFCWSAWYEFGHWFAFGVVSPEFSSHLSDIVTVIPR